MPMIEPRIVNKDSAKDVVIQLHGQDIMITYDSKRFKVFFGVCDSGSSLRFRVEPMEV
jgi:hypothetical protein